MQRTEGTTNRAESLDRTAFDRAVAVLAAAFRGYPVMRFVLGRDGDRAGGVLDDLVAYFTASRMERGWPVLGVRARGRLAAVANVSPPIPSDPPPALVERRRRLDRAIGPEAVSRFESFARATRSFTPDRPHHDLGMLGVHPDHRGEGHARTLLEAVRRLAENDPESTGVFLTTENPANLPFYDRFGYRRVGRVELDGLTTWGLFLPVD